MNNSNRCIYVYSMNILIIYHGLWWCVDSVGSGAASNLSSPGVIQQQRMSLVESVTGDMSAVSIGQSGLYLCSLLCLVDLGCVLIILRWYTQRQRCCTFHGRCTRPSATVPSLVPLRESGTCYHRRSRHCRHCGLWSMHWRPNCLTDCTTTHTSGNSSIDTSLIRDIYCSSEVLFETCVAMKFVDDSDDDDDDTHFFVTFKICQSLYMTSSHLLSVWEVTLKVYALFIMIQIVQRSWELTEAELVTVHVQHAASAGTGTS